MDIEHTSVNNNDLISTLSRDSTNVQSWNSLKNEILKEYESPACIMASTYTLEGKQQSYPSPHILNRLRFGKPSFNHWFFVKGCLKNTIFFLIKDNWIPAENLKAIHPDSKRLCELIISSLSINFSPLHQHQLNYASQTEIPEERISMFTAALIHYNLDPALVIWYIQVELTASQLDINSTLSQLRLLVNTGDFSQADYDDQQ